MAWILLKNQGSIFNPKYAMPFTRSAHGSFRQLKNMLNEQGKQWATEAMHLLMSEGSHATVTSSSDWKKPDRSLSLVIRIATGRELYSIIQR